MYWTFRVPTPEYHDFSCLADQGIRYGYCCSILVVSSSGPNGKRVGQQMSRCWAGDWGCIRSTPQRFTLAPHDAAPLRSLPPSTRIQKGLGGTYCRRRRRRYRSLPLGLRLRMAPSASARPPNPRGLLSLSLICAFSVCRIWRCSSCRRTYLPSSGDLCLVQVWAAGPIPPLYLC
jgi:hypothetical protein